MSSFENSKTSTTPPRIKRPVSSSGGRKTYSSSVGKYRLNQEPNYLPTHLDVYYEENAKIFEEKMKRKQIEEEAFIIKNRLNLLKFEEKRALKQINDTRKKTMDVLELKRKNLEDKRMKEERKFKEMEDLFRKSQAIRKLREDRKSKLSLGKTLVYSQNQNDFIKLKEDKLKNHKRILSSRGDSLDRNVQMAKIIRNKERENEEKKRNELENKRFQMKLDYERRVESEAFQRKKREEEISKMEIVELEMVRRLQNTQNLQKSALSELEKAVSIPTGEIFSATNLHNNSKIRFSANQTKYKTIPKNH